MCFLPALWVQVKISFSKKYQRVVTFTKQSKYDLIWATKHRQVATMPPCSGPVRRWRPRWAAGLAAAEQGLLITKLTNIDGSDDDDDADDDADDEDEDAYDDDKEEQQHDDDDDDDDDDYDGDTEEKG
jgi:hypothetical protein